MTVPMIKSIGDVPYPIDTHSDALSPLLTAGAALGITGEATDSAAWLQRVSTSDGPTTVKSIHGRTLRWNQLNNNNMLNPSVTQSGVTITKGENGAVTISGTATENGDCIINANSKGSVVGHKYLIKGCPAGGGTNKYFIGINGSFTDAGSGGIVTAASEIQNFRFDFRTGQTFDNVVMRPQLFDLTAMFGAGNEPATVAEFEALFPDAYYEYDAGSLLSVNMDGIETVGFNQYPLAEMPLFTGGYAPAFDKSQCFVALGNNQYRVQIDGVSNATTWRFGIVTYEMDETPTSGSTVEEVFSQISYSIYKQDFGYMGNGNGTTKEFTFTTNRNVYVRLCVVSGDTIPASRGINPCVHLVWSGRRNGEYEPYWQQTRPIPAGTLRGAGSVYDELTETERITRVGERAYQSGDESDATVITDGTVTHYPLATPTTTPIDPPLNMTYRTAAGGTERVMVPTGENSAPPTIVAAQGYTAESLRDAALATIAPVENGKASTNYGVGAYLVHGGQLCKVTTAIATGEAITIGTNVVTTTVMAEVIALIAQ